MTMYPDPVGFARPDTGIGFARPDPLPLGGLPRTGMTDTTPMYYPPGIHWFGPRGAGISYPHPRPVGPLAGGPIVHLPEQPLGFHPALAHVAARRAARQALLFRRRRI